MARRYLKYYTCMRDYPNYSGLGQRRYPSRLTGPFSHKGTLGLTAAGKKAYLTRDNAVGFVARALSGPLVMCHYGYHMYENRFGRRLGAPGSMQWTSSPWYWVEPVGEIKRFRYAALGRDNSDKIAARSYRILGQVKPWEVRRANKDRLRSHKKRT